MKIIFCNETYKFFFLLIFYVVIVTKISSVIDLVIDAKKFKHNQQSPKKETIAVWFAQPPFQQVYFVP